MLKVIGHIYADSTDKLGILVEAVTREGFSVAYDSGISVVVMEEVVEDESTDQTT